MKRLIIFVFLVLCLANSANAGQTVLVSGRILSDIHEPIIGSTVQEVGKTNGTVTNVEGRFTLRISKGGFISVNFLGYMTSVLGPFDEDTDLGDIPLTTDHDADFIFPATVGFLNSFPFLSPRFSAEK